MIAWSANTAFASGALVTKVTPDGTVWKSAGGTSGNSEPTWPTIPPWTVTDGSITWSLGTSFRANAVTGVLSVLSTFHTANPSLLAGVSAVRPSSLTTLDLPGAYIASRDEQIVHSAGALRTRTLNGLTVVLVDTTTNNLEGAGRMDVLVDGLVDAFTAAFHGIDGYSLLEPTAVTDLPTVEGSADYLGVALSLSSTFKTEGRQ